MDSRCLGGKPWGKKESRVLAILQYFRLDPDNNDKILELVCKTCGEEDAVAYSGNTSNLRSHLSHVHKDLFCKLVSKEKEEGVSSDSSPNKHGMLQAMLPPVSEERRNELHKKFALWIVRNNRPLTIGEHDVELRDIFHYIFQ
eukprot:gene30488-38114_t